MAHPPEMTDEEFDDLTFESELATKAPESDAHEQSAATGDTQPPATTTAPSAEASTQAAPGPAAETTSASNDKSEHASCEMTTLANTPVYTVLPASYPSVPAKLLLLLPPGTGPTSASNQHLARAWSSKGFIVLMPDLTSSDPSPSRAPTTQEPSSLIGGLKGLFADTAQAFKVDMWLARHPPTLVLPLIMNVLREARELYADAIAFGGGVYGAGYSFGGRYALLLAGSVPGPILAGERDVGPAEHDPESAPEPVLKAVAVAHPSAVSGDDFSFLTKGSRVCLAAVAGDAMLGDEVREDAVKAARERGADVEVKTWEGVPHGFAIPGEYDDAAIAAAEKEAFATMTAFLASEKVAA